MNTLINALRLLTIVILVQINAPFAQAENLVPRSYEPKPETLTRIARDLHQALDDKRRRMVVAEVQEFAAAKGFFVAPVCGDAGAPNAVAVSPSFVACLNQLAHARALEPVASGYFAQFVLALPPDATEPWGPVGKAMPVEQVWNFDTMNHQVSLFNQMAGTLVAIQMAHHYLGHTKKTPVSGVGSAVPAPITKRLTEKEWRDAVLKGAKNALDCGLGVEGFRSLLGAVGAPSVRPAWSACFIHPTADVAKISRELEKLEKDFFLVDQ